MDFFNKPTPQKLAENVAIKSQFDLDETQINFGPIALENQAFDVFNAGIPENVLRKA